ncbi:MAG: PIN domain-containing protein [Chloroflexota bacterium]|nr:MAG: PIN domain-containing protein [Chloroflexota bacterium]
MERVGQSIVERRVFVDTSAILAIVDSLDRHHAQAMEIMGRCANEQYTLLTTRFVVVETHAGLLRAVGFHEARAFLQNGMEEIAEVLTEESDYRRAKEIVFQHKDKDYSLCDAISFAVMDRLNLSLAFAFDDHFRQYGLSTPIGQTNWP